MFPFEFAFESPLKIRNIFKILFYFFDIENLYSFARGGFSSFYSAQLGITPLRIQIKMALETEFDNNSGVQT